MSLTLSDLETIVRNLINDNSTTGTDLFTYGSTAVFTLTESNAIAITSVSKNDIESGVTYTYDATTNKVTVTSSLVAGDTIEVIYTYYPNYSSTEIEGYIKAAIVHLSINRYYDWEIEDDTIYPEPEVNEKNLIAMVTAILMKPDNISYRLPDITINAPKDLPTVDKINKTIAIFKRTGNVIFFIG